MDVLNGSLGKKVSLLLKDGRSMVGLLGGYDDHMNMVLEDTGETTADGTEKRLGTVVLRGSNVIRISLV